MAEVNVKAEFKSSPSPEARLSTPRVDNPLFVDEKKSAKVVPGPSSSTPSWKHCKEFDPFAQVETKEKAVHDSITHLNEIHRSLRRHSPEVPSASKWIDRIGKCPLLQGMLMLS
jgi:hypothetical protein